MCGCLWSLRLFFVAVGGGLAAQGVDTDEVDGVGLGCGWIRLLLAGAGVDELGGGGSVGGVGRCLVLGDLCDGEERGKKNVALAIVGIAYIVGVAVGFWLDAVGKGDDGGGYCRFVFEYGDLGMFFDMLVCGYVWWRL